MKEGKKEMIRSLTSKQKDKLVERLAELEHEQWCVWTKNIAPEIKELIAAVSISISDIDNNILVVKTAERLLRWSSFWIPYDELNEHMKEQDRKWAREVIQIFNELHLEIVSK